MSRAICIFQGEFGRVALLDMDKSLVPHAHLQCHVLLKASGADSHFHVRGQLQPLTDRDAVLVNAWEPHYYAHPPHAERTVILALYIEPSWLATIQSSLQVSGSPGFFPCPSARITPRIRARADDLATYMLTHQAMAKDRVESMIFELMIAVIERFSEWRHAGSLISQLLRQAHDPRIKHAIGYMRENLDRRIELGQVAREVGLSRAHFFLQFRRCTQVTPSVFLNTLRMESAIRRLSTSPRCSLAELSLDLGFSAQGHFTRFFRHHLGIAPSEYRQIVDVFGTALAGRCAPGADPRSGVWTGYGASPSRQADGIGRGA